MDREDLTNITEGAFTKPYESGRFVTHQELDAKIDKRVDERIDAKIGQLKNTVMAGAFGIILSVGMSAWHVSNELRDAVKLADESDERLNARGLWMQRQEQHDRQQDRALERLDPNYQPPGFQETPL